MAQGMVQGDDATIPLAQDTATTAPGGTLGRYRVIEMLGAGGMGVVLRAQDPELSRDVAIKVLRTEGGITVARQHVLAEAKAMAQVTHPNVVTVYDVGTTGDAVFIAMELIDGTTLRAWLEAAPRPWREIVTRFIAAGRGLEAVHKAGLVHRDFKPENVMIGADGRPRVTDFGVAEDAAVVVSGDEPLETSVSSDGRVIGTPRYMAPEQWRCEVSDARADQFSFGVALWMALHRAPPFAGQTIHEIQAAVLGDQRAPRPTSTGVPAWLTAIVDRCLRVDREARWPDMATLLAALERRLHRRRTAVAIAGVAVAVAAASVGSAVVLSSRRPAAVPGAECAKAGDRVREVWTPTRRATIVAAFDATKVPYARGVADAVLPRLDAAADALAGARIEACRATKVRGEQSDARLDLRIGCLDQQLGRLDATIALLARVDAKLVENAPRALDAIPDPAACADVARLSLLPLEPIDPEVRTRIAGLRPRLAAVAAARAAGQGRAVVDEARAVAAAAEPLGHCPLTVEAQYELAWIQRDMAGNKAELDAAIDLLNRVVRAADACGDDSTRANALIDVLGAWDPADAAGLARLSSDAEAAVQRLSDPRIEVRLRANQARAVRSTGDFDRAIELFDQMRAAVAPFPRQAMTIDFELTLTLLQKGSVERARPLALQTVAAMRRFYGEGHPLVGQAMLLEGDAYLRGNENLKAVETFTEASRLLERALGPEHRTTLEARVNIGVALEAAGDAARAAAHYEEVRPIIVRVLGADSQHGMFITTQLASAYTKLGRLDEALPLARDVVATSERRFGPDHPVTAQAHATLGTLLYQRRELDAAIVELRTALAVQKQRLGDEHRETAATELNLAVALVDAGQPTPAIPLLRAARPIMEREQADSYLAILELTLARALWDTGGDRAEAIRLAKAALARPGIEDTDRALAEAWLARQR